MAKEMMCDYKGHSTMMLILGLLILINAYWAVVGWDYFIGIILVLKGLVKLSMK
jgi:uncharacterized membrane protein HdeD (DUF308 family)